MTAALPDGVAIVTGGGSGIGRACAAALSARGTRCVLVGRRQDRLEAAAADLGGPVTVVAADLTEAGKPERVVEETLAAHGRIDAVGQLVTDDLVAEYQIAGTPEECRSQLQHLIGAHSLDAFFVNIISPGPAANYRLLSEVVSIATGN